VRADFTLYADGSSIVLVRPCTKAAKAWVRENVSLEPWQWLGQAFGCEPRCVRALIEGAQNDGLTWDHA
jgi:hypothetical protein